MAPIWPSCEFVRWEEHSCQLTWALNFYTIIYLSMIRYYLLVRKKKWSLSKLFWRRHGNCLIIVPRSLKFAWWRVAKTDVFYTVTRAGALNTWIALGLDYMTQCFWCRPYAAEVHVLFTFHCSSSSVGDAILWMRHSSVGKNTNI
jgi:hypothetical protein